MQIQDLEKVQINGTEQWVLIQGKADDAPLLIHVQAGPGFPMISEAAKMQKTLRLESNHLVAYWDQRGCGKSFSPLLDPQSINLLQLTADLIECTRFLLKKYGRKQAILLGYSLGAVIGLRAANEQPDLFERLILVGTDVDIPFANRYASEFALQEASKLKKNSLLREAMILSSLSMTNAKTFQRRAKLLTNLGGMMQLVNYNQLFFQTVKSLLTCRFYTIKDVFKAIRGMDFCQNALLPELNTLNLSHQISSVKADLHFIHGAKDAIAPWQIVNNYFKLISAPYKTFTLFEHSAHMPHLEEAGKFSRLVEELITSKGKLLSPISY